MENLEKGFASLIDGDMDVWNVPAYYRERNVAKPTPYFEERDARRILEEMEDAGCIDFKYDGKKGTFVYRDMGADEWQDVRTIKHDGKKLFAVGDDWTWEDTTDTDTKEYKITFCIYVDCSPRGEETEIFQAIDEDEAIARARDYARYKAKAYEFTSRDAGDVWLNVEDIEEL